MIYHILFIPLKTPAVKPCIVYIIVLLCSVGSKVSAAERFVGHPIGLIPHCWLTCEITGYQP